MTFKHINMPCSPEPIMSAAKMSRTVAAEFDRQATRAATSALADLPRLWPGPALGGVSGDGIARAKAARYFGTPPLDLWELVRAPDQLHRQFQRYTDAEGDPPGDCWRTALACLIQVPRDEVPHFIHEYQGHKVGPRGTLSTPLWWVKSVEWVEQQRPGWTLENYAPRFPVYDGDGPSRVIISGQSPRGDWLHAVIADSVTGALVHDPHPSGAGVLDQQEMAALIPVT